MRENAAPAPAPDAAGPGPGLAPAPATAAAAAGSGLAPESAPALRLVGAMHLFGRTSPPLLLFHGRGPVLPLLAHLAGQLDAWENEGTVGEPPQE